MATNYRSLIKTVSFNKKTEQEVIDFVNAQENFSDTVLFLIQKEICTNGISNLQQYIPSSRTIADVQRLITQGNKSIPHTFTSGEAASVSAEVELSSAESFSSEPIEADESDLEEESDFAEVPPELRI